MKATEPHDQQKDNGWAKEAADLCLNEQIWPGRAIQSSFIALLVV
jgi:hypothetical protein